MLSPRLDRRTLLIGGGVGIGLVLAYAVWPRDYPVTLTPAKGETIFGGWIKIGDDGHVTVAVPQTEHGQGVWTTLPQIVAAELGADWRTVGVEPAPLNPLYANPLGLRSLFEGDLDRALDGRSVVHIATVGSSSLRMFEGDLRHAAAVARVMLMKAAANRWDADWRKCRTEAGFVILGNQRLRFAELAAEAAQRDRAGTGRVARRGDGQSVGQVAAPARRAVEGRWIGQFRGRHQAARHAVRVDPAGPDRR